MQTKTETLTDHDLHGVLVNALYCAARQYQDIAANIAAENSQSPLLKTFETQAKEARALAERIEQASCVNLLIEKE